MFMVEANEAVARLLDSLQVPFLRRIHPDPDVEDSSRLRQFVEAAGHKIPKDLDRKALQHLLAGVHGKPESFAVNLAVLKSLTRAEYSPKVIGHFALASEHYCHFTSPIRRYADLTIHRLLDSYFTARAAAGGAGGRRKKHLELQGVVGEQELTDLGKHISFTERRGDDAERELRQVKILELLQKHIGDEFPGVITSIANFGIFVQLTDWLIDGLIRYEDLMDDWWDVDERAGMIRGQRTGQRIHIGDTATVRIVRVEPARRELNLAIIKLHSRGTGGAPLEKPAKKSEKGKKDRSKGKPQNNRGGGSRRQQKRR
jgi:ribonuclease R